MTLYYKQQQIGSIKMRHQIPETKQTKDSLFHNMYSPQDIIIL